MPEHYPKNITEDYRWCNRCGRRTKWSVSAGRLGYYTEHEAPMYTKKQLRRMKEGEKGEQQRAAREDRENRLLRYFEAHCQLAAHKWGDLPERGGLGASGKPRKPPMFRFARHSTVLTCLFPGCGWISELRYVKYPEVVEGNKNE